MPAQPVTASPTAGQSQAETPSAAEIWAQDAPYYVKLLREMAEAGGAIVRIALQRVRMQADEPSHKSIMADIYLPFDTPPLLDPHNKFVREATESIDVLTRAIRRNIMLAEKIAQEPATPPSAGQRPPAPKPDPASDRIRRDIEEALNRKDANRDHEHQDHDGTEAEKCGAERPERLDRPEPEDDIAARPIPHIIAEICRELGLDALPQPKSQERRTPQDIKIAPVPDAPPQAAAPAAPNNSEAPPPKARTPKNAHQPGPSTPPTPFPRL